MVVLMNFIIADMGSTYERVKERSNVTKLKERAGLLLEAERCISFVAPRHFWDRVFGEYLFVCTKATQHDDGTQDSWDSFTGSIKNKLDEVQRSLSEELRHRQEKTLERIEQMFDSLNSQLTELAARVGSLEERKVVEEKEKEEEELDAVQRGLSEELRQMRDRQEAALRQMAEMLASLDAQLKALAGSQVPSPVDI